LHLKLTRLTPLWKLRVFGTNKIIAFMTRVALVAEKLNHHPKWTNVWNTVEVWLATHDAGNTVTDKDRKLAAEIDKLTKD
jgi:4a-hydroxytetrahydrobiopterin dehydratase